MRKNDIVLLVDESQPRSRWSLGRILDVFPDKTGHVKTVLVKSCDAIYKRPITKLCLILKTEDDQND